MAKTWQITTASGGTTYNLLTGTLYPLADTWSISPADGDGFVTETMELAARNATDANIMAAVQTLTELAEQAERWQEDRFNTDSVWYVMYGASESAKRAFVKSIEIIPLPRSKFTPFLAETAAFYQMSIRRLAAWELTAHAQNFATASAVSALGGSAAAGTIKGSYPARIDRFLVQGNTFGGGSGTLYRVWAGLRPTHKGITNFTPLWELESGTAGTDSSLATDATNASPSGGSNNYLSCDFGTTTTLVERAGMTVDQATATTDYDHFIGNYLVLLRCKLSAAGTVGVQMRTGYASGSNFRAAVETYVTNTDWRLMPIGEVNIPPYTYRAAVAASNTVKNFEIQVHAEQVSGTPSFYMDCLLLMPSEHMVYVDRVALDDQYDNVNWFTHEDGTQEMVLYKDSGGEPDVGAIGVFHNWNCPIESGRVYVAAERETLHHVDDLLDMTMYHYSRHRVHREA